MTVPDVGFSVYFSHIQGRSFSRNCLFDVQDDFCEPVLGTADHSLGMADHSAISVFHSSGSSTNLSAVAMSSASNAGTSDTCQAGGWLMCC